MAFDMINFDIKMKGLETTTDLLNFSRVILSEAELVGTRNEHKRVLEKQDKLLKKVNSVFETGYFTGDAYRELWEAKNIINSIGVKANEVTKEG